ncbi:MAG TPA: hypothetical protein VL494_13915 [Steroidobacteraceae bacterium]|nr:hypothetical protein [Steroidobacteraceae bacterium]
MKSAFGIKLTERGGELLGPNVRFWQATQGWCGSVYIDGFLVSETIGCASPQACYRSLRGRVKNLRNALTKALGEKTR